MSLTTSTSAPVQLGPALRLQARIAVTFARWLAARRPATIRAILSRLARRIPPATATEAWRAHAAIVAASPASRGRRACRVRSLATVLLCRRYRTSATWCVGIRAGALPDAHAWVEADGHPIGEATGVTAAYRKILTIPHEADT